MLVIKKYILLASIIFIGMLFLPRLVMAWQYNVGHLFFFTYLEEPDKEKKDFALLQRAEEKFLRVKDDESSNLRVNWRLSFAAFEQGKFNEAVVFFVEAQEKSPPDFLLTEQSTEFYTSYEYHQLNALASEQNKTPVDAIQLYRHVLALEPREWDIDLYRRYYRLLTNWEDSEIQNTGEQLLDFTFSDELDHVHFEDHMTPFLPVLPDDNTSGCWELQQISYDRTALEVGPLLPLQLRWQHVIDPSERYTESLVVANLAPNAGFEWGESNGNPIGYPDTIYTEDNPVKNHHLLESEILSEITKVAGLFNSKQYYNSSYASNRIPINSDKLYFQGGWIKSEDGKAYMGHRWRGDLEDLERKYQYVTGGVQNEEWAFYGKIMIIPEPVDEINFWLLNYNSEGVVYFDDLMFFEINPPTCDH